MRIPSFFAVLVSLIFLMVSDTFGQADSKSQVAGSKQTQKKVSTKQESKNGRFVVVKNDVHMIRVDTRTGKCWRLEMAKKGSHLHWVPIKELNSLKGANDWLKKEKEKRIAAAAKLDEKRFATWAKQVLLKPEYGRVKPAVRRWNKLPKISIFGGELKHKKVVESAIADINSVLAETKFGKLELANEQDESAELRVYLTEHQKFEEIARKHEFKIPQYNLGLFALKWDHKNVITEGQVLIAIDKLKGKELKHIVLEEITQALGPANDSDIHRTSMFYGGRSFVTELSERDRLLLKMMYVNLKPGDRGSHIDRAVKNMMYKRNKDANGSKKKVRKSNKK